ncbi:hypothetical protein INT45_008648 [Circinella minor]|uniref:Uncharacterized protein n=1 Tax=Circinella minor TaxID=1195481 RepID=A0A8H7RKU3_9FUNG|nr:hypothetical protein INT45_008648 [Circinella minor]
MSDVALSHNEIREAVNASDGEDPLIGMIINITFRHGILMLQTEEFIRVLDAKRTGTKYEPSVMLPGELALQEMLERAQQLEEQVLKLMETKKQRVPKWKREDEKIKEAIRQCAIERKGYNRTEVPKSTMFRWAQEYRETYLNIIDK